MPQRTAHIIGLGRSGVAVAELLISHGWTVIASDSGNGVGAPNSSSAPGELRLVADRLVAAGARVWLNGHSEAMAQQFDLVVVSPGIPLDMPVLVECRERGIPILGELEVAWQYSKGTFVAVSGTNGKSTTTALIGHLFGQSGKPSFTCGNIGTPLSTFANATTEDSLIALEVSSFQLSTIDKFHPQVAVLMNLTPDHISWHKSIENYYGAKAAMWRNQSTSSFLRRQESSMESDWVVYFDDDAECRKLVKSAKSNLFPFSVERELPMGAFLADGNLIVRRSGLPDYVQARSDLAIPGIHNSANALAAIAAVLLCGIAPDQVSAGIRSFKGIPHRLENVGVVNGVTYINDSKATNIDAGKWALLAMGQGIILIAGGLPKGGGFKELRPCVDGRVKRLILIGEAAKEIAADLGDLAPVIFAENLKEAVHIAQDVAQTGQTVLLSPLCASYDQFRDFEQRGDQFRELVKGLK